MKVRCRPQSPAPPLTSASGPHQTTRFDKLLYTPVEAAHVLSVSRSTIYVLMANGDLPSVRIGSSRRIPADGLRRYIASLSARVRVNVAPRHDGPKQRQLWD